MEKAPSFSALLLTTYVGVSNLGDEVVTRRFRRVRGSSD